MAGTTTLVDELSTQPLALRGGPKAVPAEDKQLFAWPIVTEEDEQAVVDVVRNRAMSRRDITRQFEDEWAAYNGVKHAMAAPSGTMALQIAMWAAGLRRGDEMICPTLTYWASALQAYSLGATPVFADVDPETFCFDPRHIEKHIGPRTRAIMCVHYAGHPCDMDAINEIARRHKLRVIEDVSHAHGSLYKGRMVGTLGDIAAMSMMGAKAFAIGEAGMIVTNDSGLFEHVLAFSNHYRNQTEVRIPELKRTAGPDGFVSGVPLGGLTTRVTQTVMAMGRVQLRHYPRRIAEIDKAMNRFFGLLEGLPGLRPRRPAADSGSTLGAWYAAYAHYAPEELGGLPATKFVEAVKAEGGLAESNLNFPLHLHPVFNEADIYGDGKPTRIAFSERDVRQPAGSLPVAENLLPRTVQVPWFKHDNAEAIERHAAAYRKVLLRARELV